MSADDDALPQCGAEVAIALTDLTYLCLERVGHKGPHRIGISSDFDLVESEYEILRDNLKG